MYTPNQHSVLFAQKLWTGTGKMVDMKAVQEEVKKADQEKAKTKSGILDCHCVLYVHTLSSTYHTTF